MNSIYSDRNESFQIFSKGIHFSEVLIKEKQIREYVVKCVASVKRKK